MTSIECNWEYPIDHVLNNECILFDHCLSGQSEL